MANNPTVYNAAIQTSLNSFGALLNGGFLNIYTGSQPANNASLTGTLLVSFQFGATAFASASANGTTGSMAANAIASANAGNTGTFGYFALLASNGTTVVATGTAGTVSTDLILTPGTVASGQVVSITSFTVSQVQT